MKESIESQNGKTVDAIVEQALSAPTDEERARQERLKTLSRLRIKTDTVVEPEAYSLSVDGVGIFARKDIHGLKGKQKSGKSAVLKVCVAALMSGSQFRVKSELEEPKVLLLDTEQQSADVKLVIDEVKRMSGVSDDYIDSHLLLYTLRRMNYDTLLSDTRLLVEEHRPQVVLIDGLVDYVASFNDEVMSRQLIHDLLILCEEQDCAIVNVLHENKASEDENMRGHLGTVLAQKAGTVLRSSKDRLGTISVSCPNARHGTMPTWYISFSDDGHIVDADEQQQQQQKGFRHRAKANRLEKLLNIEKERFEAARKIIRDNGGSMMRSRLNSLLMEQEGLSRTTISKFISRMVDDKKLFENGKFITDDPDAFIPF